MHRRLRPSARPRPERAGRFPRIVRAAVAAACVMAMVAFAPPAIAGGRVGGTAVSAKSGTTKSGTTKSGTTTASAKASSTPSSSAAADPGAAGASAAQTLKEGAASVAQAHKALAAQESQTAPAPVAAAETRAAIESGDERAPATAKVALGGAWKLSADVDADVTDSCTAPVTSPDPQAGSYLLSLDRPAFASSVDAGSGNVAANVDDGSLCSAWESEWDVDPQWVYIDLGADATITQVVIDWDTAYATSYEVQTSNDEINWTTIYSTADFTGGQAVLDVAGSGRYVRVLGLARVYAQYGYQIDELQVFGTGGVNQPPNTAPDLALNAPVAASSEDTTDDLATSMYLPSNVDDGSTSTCWTSASADDQWISVDLGSVTKIGEVSLNWYWAGDYARAYDIQVSDDGQNWTTVYRNLYADGGTNGTGGEYGGTENIALDVSGQYVRLYAYGRQQNYGLVLCELDVYGWSAGDPTPSYTIPPLPTPGMMAAGSGSYATDDITQFAPFAPKYVTSNLTGPLKSNTWWTDLLIDPLGDGNALVPLPLEANYSVQGLGIYDPGAGYASTGGGAVNADGPPDLYLNASNITNTQNLETLVNAYSPYSVNVWLTDDGTAKMSTTLVEGSPFVYNTYSDPAAPYVLVPGLTAATNPNGGTILATDGSSYTGDSIGLTLQNTDGSGDGTSYTRYYGMFAPAGTVFTREGSMIMMDLGSGGDYLSVATLPALSDLSYYYQYAYAFVTGTAVSYSYNQAAATVTTTFADTTDLERAGFANDTLMGLEPHQWQVSSAALTPYSYPSVRGPIKVMEGDSFTTSDTFDGLLPQFAEPDVSGYSRAAVLSYLGQLDSWLGTSPSGWISEFSEPYWQGKILQPAMMAAIVAKQIGDTADLNFDTTVLKTVLDDFYTYSSTDPEHGNYFYYNSTWGTLTPYTSAYGLNIYLDDHHLTYGYFIYASAILASLDPAWAQQYGPMVELVLDDYADPNADDGMFPQFRNFDQYAGHSWAGGYADNPNGANQESSSEALQSWAAEYLWGEVTGNKTYIDAGAYGFTTELRATQDYYFNWGGDDFLPSYSYQIAGQIYGSSYWYGTYFGIVPAYIYGIQMLPTAPWLAYDGVNQADAASLYSSFVAQNGGPPTTWQHIILPFDALSNPTDALTQFNNSLSTMETDAIFNTYWFIENMASYGHQTQAVWATNSGTVQVFSNGSAYTAQVWNPTSTAETVDFANASGATGSVTVGPGLLITTNPMENLGGDTTAPTVPTGLTATASSTTQVNLAWNASTDNDKVQQYVLYRNGTEIGTTPALTYTDSGLTPDTAYSYTVAAQDEGGNLSAAGNTATATTDGVQTPLDEAAFTASTNAPSATDGEGNGPQNAITNAVDGDANSATRFSTDEDEAAGLYYQVNLGSAQTFDQIDMNATGGYAGDFAPGYQVEVSTNGTTWTTVDTVTGATAFPEIATFPTQTAQYLRVALTGATATWWSMVQFIVSNLTSGTTYPADTYSLSVCGSGNTSGSGSCVHEAPLSESGWTASSNADYGEDVPQNAITNVIDGTDATRFSTDQDQAAGLYYEVNLGSVQSFNAVDLDSGGYGSDYAHAYTIAVSDNGTSWTTVTDGTGDETPEVAPFPTQTAQYIRVTLDENSSDNWWSIVDFSLLAQNAGWTASTNTGGDAAAAIDGNPATRFTSGADQTAGMSWELDLGAPEQFDEIVMDSTDWPGDYARGYEVRVSDNGSNWTAVDTGTGLGSPESASFPVQDAQYIQVTLTAPSTANWWSIGEFLVFDSQQ